MAPQEIHGMQTIHLAAQAAAPQLQLQAGMVPIAGANDGGGSMADSRCLLRFVWTEADEGQNTSGS